MTKAEKDQLIAQSFEEFRLRSTRGEQPDPEEYAPELQESYEDFLEILEVEAVLDDLLEPPDEVALPKEFGPYTLVQEIGRGAVGIVYEAVHRELGRREAVKILRPGFLGEGTALERFRQEAKTLARLKHDHVVEVYAAGQVEGCPYYAMTLVEGVPLSRWAREQDLPDPVFVCRGLAGVADALESLHARGVLHRDVKPSNVIVQPDGKMVLADFGLARSLASARITRSGQALGTPLYMSPEQILGRREEIDGRSDVYGLGATLYEVLAGRPLFRTNDLRVLLRKVVNERPEPLRRVAPEVPAACAAIAMKAIEKRREDRYASAAAMRDDLLAYAAGEPVRGRPVSVVRRGLRRMRRYALPLAAVLLLALAWGVWFANRPAVLDVRVASTFRVFVDGEAKGVGAQALTLDPGTYEVRIEADGFEPMVIPVTLGAGERRGIAGMIPIVRDPTDRASVEAVAEALEMSALRFRDVPRNRGIPGDYALAALLPAGRVRPQDLDTVSMQLSLDAPDDGLRLEFRVNRTEVSSISLGDILSTFETRPFPEALRARLRPGDEVTWRLAAPGLASAWQAFEVVAPDEDVESDLARISEELAGQPEALRRYFLGARLLAADLPYAAWRAASQGESLDALDGSSFLVRGVLREALLDLGLQGENELWGHFQSAIPYDPAVQEAWLRQE